MMDGELSSPWVPSNLDLGLLHDISLSLPVCVVESSWVCVCKISKFTRENKKGEGKKRLWEIKKKKKAWNEAWLHH